MVKNRKEMKKLKYIFAALLVTLFVGCINNDIPYPIIEAEITEFKLEGALQSTIDRSKRTVSITLDEQTDIENVRIESFVATEGSKFELNGESIKQMPETINLSESVSLCLSIYQDYLWTITAVQPIERHVEFEGQIGDAVIDAKAQSVSVNIESSYELSNLTIKTLRLASPINSTISPDPAAVHDFTSPVEFTITQHGRESVWSVAATVAEIELSTSAASDVWARRATLSGYAPVKEGVELGFEYRAEGESDYRRVTSESLTHERGVLSGVIETEPSTTYHFRIFQGEECGEELSFTTEGAPTILNLGFEDWHKITSGLFTTYTTWFPCTEAEYGKEESYGGYWCTSNAGVVSGFKQSNIVPIDDSVSGKAAKLTTIGSIPIVGMAAASIFTGNFITNMSEPLKSPKFGRPFTGRPTKITGHYKYSPKEITVADEKKTPEMVQYKGQMDSFIIWANLEDWGDATSRPESPEVIARAELSSNAEVSEYQSFEMEFDYLIKERKPTHIVLVVSSSKYGDFYTGGVGSVLCIDEFDIVY